MIRKRAVSLIEILIVIFLIGIIGGALAINMRGGMDQGKIFKTEQNINRVYDILMMEYAKSNSSLQSVIRNKKQILKGCPFAKQGDKMLKDGWGEELSIEMSDNEDDIIITSKKLDKWREKNG